MPKPAVISVDSADLLKAMRDVRERQIPFLLAYTLTKVGQDIKDAEFDSMREVFDRPTRYTLNSLQLTPATKDNPKAVVDYKFFGGTPADRYLSPEVEGGPRSHKSHEKALIAAGLMRSDEFAVPGQGVQLDDFGNIRGGTFTRILSQLRASRDPMQNMTAKSRKRAVRAAKGQYFVMRGRSSADGVYQRTAQGIVPILIFVRAPRYPQRFPFHDVATSTFDARFELRAREAWEKYVAPKLNVKR